MGLVPLAATAWSAHGLFSTALGAAPGGKQEKSAAGSPDVKRTKLIEQKLTNLGDRTVQVSMVEIAPGAEGAKHRHPCPVFAYVLDGALVSQTEGQPVATFKAGQIFYEPANGVHAVSRNASATAPVKLLVFYLGEPDKPVSVPVD